AQEQEPQAYSLFLTQIEGLPPALAQIARPIAAALERLKDLIGGQLEAIAGHAHHRGKLPAFAVFRAGARLKERQPVRSPALRQDPQLKAVFASLLRPCEAGEDGLVLLLVHGFHPHASLCPSG